MKPELEKLCMDYTANRETVKKAFRWDNSALYAVCANIFCANGHMADTDRLKESSNGSTLPPLAKIAFIIVRTNA